MCMVVDLLKRKVSMLGYATSIDLQPHKFYVLQFVGTQICHLSVLHNQWLKPRTVTC